MNSKKMEEHPLRAAILTISNSRSFSDDTNGLLIQSALANYGHQSSTIRLSKTTRPKSNAISMNGSAASTWSSPAAVRAWPSAT